MKRIRTDAENGCEGFPPDAGLETSPNRSRPIAGRAQSDKRENTGVYAASFANPTERVRLLTTDNNALYALGNDGKSYLLWLRGRTLFAQEFKAGAIKLVGEPHALADPVAGISQTGQMNSAVSATRILLYSDSNPTSQLTWFDRSGKLLGV